MPIFTVRHVMQSKKGGSKSAFLFFFWNKSRLQSNEVCYKVSVAKL